MNHKKELEKAEGISDVFELVKTIVREFMGAEQAGLLVGLTDLGSYRGGFIGAFYSPFSNIIIINKKPIKRILETNPSIYMCYIFHIVLHEYVHSIGVYDEAQTRQLVFEMSSRFFGPNHTVTELAGNLEKFFPNLTYPERGYSPPEDTNIEFISRIDRKNTDYIN